MRLRPQRESAHEGFECWRWGLTNASKHITDDFRRLEITDETTVLLQKHKQKGTLSVRPFHNQLLLGLLIIPSLIQNSNKLCCNRIETDSYSLGLPPLMKCREIQITTTQYMTMAIYTLMVPGSSAYLHVIISCKDLHWESTKLTCYTASLIHNCASTLFKRDGNDLVPLSCYRGLSFVNLMLRMVLFPSCS